MTDNVELELDVVDLANPLLDHEGEKAIRENLLADAKDHLSPFELRLANEITIPIAGILELANNDPYLRADINHAVLRAIALAFGQMLERKVKTLYVPAMIDHTTDKFHHLLCEAIVVCLNTRDELEKKIEKREQGNL